MIASKLASQKRKTYDFKTEKMTYQRKIMSHGGSKISLHELEKKATATPNMATLLTTL